VWLPSNVVLRGAGIGNTVLKLTDNSSSIGTPDGRSRSRSERNDLVRHTVNVAVEDLTIDGNAGKQTVLMHGLRFTRAMGIEVNRVQVRDCLGAPRTRPRRNDFISTSTVARMSIRAVPRRIDVSDLEHVLRVFYQNYYPPTARTSSARRDT